MTFEEWAAKTSAMNACEKMVARFAWNMALEQAALMCREVNEDAFRMLNNGGVMYETGRMSAAMMCHDHVLNLKAEES